ncbi:MULTISPECIES: NEW3 domain-containing protein [Kribbella]|uniref:Alpha-galactosidase NEW3 domain-containing protein n=1 Tax=Kribbella karoonensis TaxID=324851 RepID=A0ABP4P6E0_9ACTN
MALIQGIPGEFAPQPWGEAILRSRELLLLRIACRPPDHEVRLPGLATTPRHVVEDHSGRALTWRRDGDDLVVRLPEAGDPPVVRVALAGKLRIVPEDTVTANADGVWDLTPAGPTAHLVARRAADVAIRFFGMIEPDRPHQIRLAGRRYGVTGHQLTRTTIGPFPMPERRVVPLAVPTGVRRILVAPVGTALASIHPGRGELTVVVTNFGRTPARGEVELPLPSGWSASAQVWRFDGLEPGQSIGWAVQVTGTGKHELRARLDAGRRSASSPYVVHL